MAARQKLLKWIPAAPNQGGRLQNQLQKTKADHTLDSIKKRKQSFRRGRASIEQRDNLPGNVEIGKIFVVRTPEFLKFGTPLAQRITREFETRRHRLI